MTERLPDMKVGRITDVMTAYTKVLLGVLSPGQGVRLGSLGCFYIAPMGITANPGERLPLTVRFSPDGTLTWRRESTCSFSVRGWAGARSTSGRRCLRA